MAKKQIIFKDGKVLEAREDGLYYDGDLLSPAEAVANTYFTTFDDTDLTGGILTVDHDLGASALGVVVTDDSGVHFGPDKVYEVTENQLKVDLSILGTLGTTWSIRVYGNLVVSVQGGDAGGLLENDRYSEYVVVSAGQDSAGVVGLTYTPRYPAKVAVYSQGLLQKNSLMDNMVASDYAIMNTNEVHINANSGTGGLSDLLAEGDELQIVYEIEDPDAPIYDLFDHSVLAEKALTPVDKTGAPATLEDSDLSKLVRIDDALTIPTGLTVGFQCIVVNESVSDITVTKAGLTEVVPSGATLAAGGIATVAITDTDVLLLKGELS